MAFVKLDCGLLDSTLWPDREARELFITALLMAIPQEFTAPIRQIEVRTLAETGFEVPAGWYGFIAAAGSGIIRRAGMDIEAGLAALERLGAPELESRSPDFEGRRLVRVDGGYISLNYAKYREKDHTAAARAKKYRDNKLASKPVKTIRQRVREQVNGDPLTKSDNRELRRLKNGKPAKSAQEYDQDNADSEGDVAPSCAAIAGG